MEPNELFNENTAFDMNKLNLLDNIVNMFYTTPNQNDVFSPFKIRESIAMIFFSSINHQMELIYMLIMLCLTLRTITQRFML
jgi:hypothetical protein